MLKLTRQALIVRDHLRKDAHLTSWQAEGVYRIRRLASRIDELRAAGYEIDTQTMKDATGQRYTRYSFSRAQKRRAEPIGLPRIKYHGVEQFTSEEVRDAIRVTWARCGLGVMADREADDVIAQLYAARDKPITCGKRPIGVIVDDHFA